MVSQAQIHDNQEVTGEKGHKDTRLMRPIRVIAPQGTIVNARPPAAVAGGNVDTSDIGDTEYKMNRHERRHAAKLGRSPLLKTESKVTVRLMEDQMMPEGRRRFIRVELYSHRRVATGALKSQADVFPWECSSESEFERKIETIAGTMAENQCENYGDNHDPSECARRAKEAYRELKMDQQLHIAPSQERG